MQPHRLTGAERWRLLATPVDRCEKVEVGVIAMHPSRNNRLAYATRARTDRSPDLGRTRVVVQDFDDGGGNHDTVLALFSLRELVKRTNEFRRASHSEMLAATAHDARTQDALHSLQSSTPHSAMPYTVETIGAIQSMAFLTRDAIRCQVPPGYVKEEPSTAQRLMIGFRRCVVIASIFHRKEDAHSCARGVEVVAYIGPDDIDEFELDEKASKRQPSSFPIPVAENLLAYGCYDGGIRFYDIVRRRQGEPACCIHLSRGRLNRFDPG